MFQEGKVYVDRFSRSFFYEHGSLHTSTELEYNASNEEDYKLIRLTKEQMITLVREKKKSRYIYR